MAENIQIIELTDDNLEEVTGGTSACGCNQGKSGSNLTGAGYSLSGVPTSASDASSAATGVHCITVCWGSSSGGVN